MSDLTKEEVNRRCQDLVYKVAYSFYDSPYIILLRILVEESVITEKRMSEILNIGPNDVRKYMGMLHVHRLVKRHVNKEKAPLTHFQQRQMASGGPNAVTKARDVIYWYLDYREFADVVKYRIAMMRRAIDEKVKAEVGKRGYLCPSCHKLYDPLDLGHLFDPGTGGFLCEVCNVELMEDDPSLHGDPEGGQDRMQRFNVATAPIRDALKSIEGARLPAVNIIAWIAQNVAADSVPLEGGVAEGGRKVDVVIGATEDDGEAQRKLEDEQRAANALPEWYTKSTVTGENTSLGNKEAAAVAKAAAERAAASGPKKDVDEDDALAAHYALMEEEGEDNLEAEAAELGGESTPAPDSSAIATPVGGTPAEAAGEATPNADAPSDVMVMVGGKPMRLADVGEAEEELMTPEEYEAYFDATAS